MNATSIDITLNSKDLLKATAPLSSLVATKQVIPILSNFLFDIKKNLLTITASDLYTSVTTELPVKTSASTRIAIPGTLLIDTLRNLPEQPLHVAINQKSYNIIIKTTNGNYRIACESHIDFPEIPNTTSTSTVALPAQTLRKAFKQTVFASGKDEMFPNLAGVNMSVSPQGIIFVATDGHRLVEYTLHHAFKNVMQTQRITIPTPSLQMLIQLLDDSAESINMVIEEKHLFLKTKTQHIAISIIDEPFPDYQNIIPKKHPHRAIVSTQALQSSIKLIDCYASQTTHEISLQLDNNKLQLQAENIEFSNKGETTLPCTYQGSPLILRLHAGLFAEMVKNMRDSILTLHLDTPDKAIVLTPEKDNDNEKLLMLMMPIAPMQEI